MTGSAEHGRTEILMSRLVAGIDSSTQSCKVVIRDAETGRLLRHGEAPHPEGTEVDPHAWWEALCAALHQAGGLDDVAAVSVAAQQHGMVCLDDDGEVVRPALLWNDLRSAAATESLLRQAGAGEAGKAVWAKATGSVPVPSFTVTKLRWLAVHEPASARRTAAVALPHDWLTWRLAGSGAISELATDRSDASGTGYFAPATGEYLPQYLAAALGHDALLPRVLGPHEPAGSTPGGALLGPGAGDNAAAALSLGAGPADVIVSVGTSGTVCGVAEAPTADPTGMVAGFADATGEFLPLVCTLNAARVLDAATRLLGTEHAELDRLALSAPAGSGGLVLVPYLAGERTPSRPEATGSLHGLTLGTATPEYVARAAVEGMLCGLGDGLDALAAQGVAPERVLLIGGGARSEAVRRIAPAVLARPVAVPPPGEYVADGAARQAAWVLSGQAAPPSWPGPEWATYRAAPAGGVR
jgi:xylulokinase